MRVFVLELHSRVSPAVLLRELEFFEHDVLHVPRQRVRTAELMGQRLEEAALFAAELEAVRAERLVQRGDVRERPRRAGPGQRRELVREEVRRRLGDGVARAEVRPELARPLARGLDGRGLGVEPGLGRRFREVQRLDGCVPEREHREDRIDIPFVAPRLAVRGEGSFRAELRLQAEDLLLRVDPRLGRGSRAEALVVVSDDISHIEDGSHDDVDAPDLARRAALGRLGVDLREGHPAHRGVLSAGPANVVALNAGRPPRLGRLVRFVRVLSAEQRKAIDELAVDVGVHAEGGGRTIH
mmetsp:Transcript_32107/g.99179  ORF Transcript_32107/g.99179 Transcript_32107/m.99179 type:complete len:298 (+) Transcript_32107:418-1311(+)